MGISTPESLPDTDTGPASPAPREPRLVLEPGLIRKMKTEKTILSIYLVRGRPLPCLNSCPPPELLDPGLGEMSVSVDYFLIKYLLGKRNLQF